MCGTSTHLSAQASPSAGNGQPDPERPGPRSFALAETSFSTSEPAQAHPADSTDFSSAVTAFFHATHESTEAERALDEPSAKRRCISGVGQAAEQDVAGQGVTADREESAQPGAEQEGEGEIDDGSIFVPEGQQRWDFDQFAKEVLERIEQDEERHKANEDYYALLDESLESAFDEPIPEREQAELIRILTSDPHSEHKLSSELASWTPPAESQPNRMQVEMPDLEGQRSSGDIIVGSGPSAKTYARDIELDPAIRFSSKHALSLPKEHVFVFLPPNNFDANRSFSLRTRWMTCHAMLNSVQQSTLETYSYGPLRWLFFCEEEGIPPEERFPMRQDDLARWLAVTAHDFSESYTRKHIEGIRLWHLIHLVPWTFDPTLQAQILRGAAVIAGPPKDPRRPITLKDIVALRDYLETDGGENGENDGRNTAMVAAALLMFFGMCRAKDILLPRKKPTWSKKKNRWLRAFDPRYDPSRADFAFFSRTKKDPPMVKLHLPWDKVKKEKGADVWVAEQSRFETDLEPVSTLKAHFAYNQPGSEDPAFSFVGRDGVSRVFLTKSYYRQVLNAALEANGRTKVDLHGFRIGGFNFYKLNKVDMSNVMLFGRWSSRAMQKYQRKEKKTSGRFMANLEHGMPEDEDSSSGDEDSDSGSDSDEGDE